MLLDVLLVVIKTLAEHPDLSEFIQAIIAPTGENGFSIRDDWEG